MLNAVKHLYRSSNNLLLRCSGRGASLLFGIVWLLFLILSTTRAQAQRFDFAAKESVETPTSTALQIRRYIETHDGVNLKIFAGKYQYIPIFNVLDRSQKRFVDGIYFFTWGAHNSGRLLINQKGKVVILKNESVLEILADFSGFLKQHSLPEAAQVAYLSALSAFIKFRYENQQMLMKSGGLDELKAK